MKSAWSNVLSKQVVLALFTSCTVTGSTSMVRSKSARLVPFPFIKHLALSCVLFEQPFGDAGGAAGRVGVLVALGAERGPFHRVGRDVVARQQCRRRAGVDAQRVLCGAARHTELTLRRGLPLHPFPHQLVLAVRALVLEEQDRFERRAAAAMRAAVVHAATDRAAGVLRAEIV